jgi:hypothetical protein
MIGAYSQRLRSFKHDVPRRLARPLSGALRDRQQHLDGLPAGYTRERGQSIIKYYSEELDAVLKAWPKALLGKSIRSDLRRQASEWSPNIADRKKEGAAKEP